MTLTSSASCLRTPSQYELFGLVTEATVQMTACSSPCPACGSTVAIVGPGAGPHWGVL